MPTSAETFAAHEATVREQYKNEPASATGWDDIATSLIGRRLFSNQGTVDYNFAENAVVFSRNGDIADDNDCIIWNVQKPHGAKTDSLFRLHMHWEQDTATDKQFTLQYRIQSNGVVKTTDWTEVVISTDANNVFVYSGGTMNQITELVNIDWSAASISSTVQLRMTRSDAVNDTLNVTFVDGHVERDQERGSRTVYSK